LHDTSFSDTLLLCTQGNLRVNANFELKECQNGGTHLKETEINEEPNRDSFLSSAKIKSR